MSNFDVSCATCFCNVLPYLRCFPWPCACRFSDRPMAHLPQQSTCLKLKPRSNELLFFVVHLPLPSMYHIFTYICLIVRIFMANVDKHAIHGWYGTCSPNYKFLTFLWPKPCSSSKSQDVADSRSWRRNRQKPAQNGQHKNKQIKITYHNRRSILFA